MYYYRANDDGNADDNHCDGDRDDLEEEIVNHYADVHHY